MKPTIEDTVALMMAAHAGQHDKAGVPYYLHPLRVMRRLAPLGRPTLAHAALLHDVLEDTAVTVKDLAREGYTRQIQKVVELVTRDKLGRDRERTYLQWIEFIGQAGNVDAILVKYADLLDNHAPGRLAALPAKYRGLARRQEQALARLGAFLPAGLRQQVVSGDIPV